MSAIVAAVAGVGAAVVGGIAADRAGKRQAQAAGQAADAQVQANRENIEFQQYMFQQSRADQAPWREVGARAIQNMEWAFNQGHFNPGYFEAPEFSFTQQDFEADPGYQFRQQEGVNALDASAASRGLLLSGAQQKALQRFGQGLASQEYSDAFNRALATHQTQFGDALDAFNTNAAANQNRFNQMASMAQVGQAANQATQQARSQMAQQVGQSTINTGNAIAQGAINAGNASASAYQNMAGAAQGGINNALFMYGLSKL